MMKFKVLALAALCACAAGTSSFAAEFTVARAAAAVANNKVLFTSGASASIQLVYQAFDELCDPADTNGKSAFTAAAIAADTNVSPGDSSPSWGNFGAYGCKWKPAASLPAAPRSVLQCERSGEFHNRGVHELCQERVDTVELRHQ
jgi:hypothetical protein